MRHVLGWLLVAGVWAAVVWTVVHEPRGTDADSVVTWERQQTRRRQLADNGIDIKPWTPAPPIHFTRDPSPKPRPKKATAA